MLRHKKKKQHMTRTYHDRQRLRLMIIRRRLCQLANPTPFTSFKRFIIKMERNTSSDAGVQSLVENRGGAEQVLARIRKAFRDGAGKDDASTKAIWDDILARAEIVFNKIHSALYPTTTASSS